MPRAKKDKEPRQKQKQKQKQTVIVNVGVSRRRRRQASDRSEPSAPRPPPFMPIPFPVPALRGPEPLVPPQPSLAQLIQALQAQPLGNAPAPASLAPPAIPTQAVLNPIQKDLVREVVKQQPSLFETIREQNEMGRPPISNPVSPILSSSSSSELDKTPKPSPISIPDLVLEQKYEAGPEVVVAPPNPMVKPPEPIVSASPAVSSSSKEPGGRKKIRPPKLTSPIPIEQRQPMEYPAQASSSSSQMIPGVPTPRYSMEQLLRMGGRIKDQTSEQGKQNTLEALAKRLGMSMPNEIRDAGKQAMAAWMYKRL